jgi:hypothetical protein
MEFQKNDKVVNVKTGEFGVFLKMQEVVTASGEPYVLYEVMSDEMGAVRRGWRAEEIAHWLKYVKPVTPIPAAKPA